MTNVIPCITIYKKDERVDKMAIISIRVPDNELNLFKDFAKLQDTSLSALIRNAMNEKIENELDIKIFEEYEKDKINNKVQTRPIEDLWKELEL